MTKNKDKIIQTLREEIERKDKQIDKLKEENMLLMKAALKRAEKATSHRNKKTSQ